MYRSIIIYILIIPCFASGIIYSQQPGTSSRKSLVRVADMNIGETSRIVLNDSSAARVTVISVTEKRESVTNMLINAVVKVEINGETTDLVSNSYRLPSKVGGVQVDVPVVGGNDFYDFGDGTPSVPVPSNIDPVHHAANGYGMIIHHFIKSGHYLVRVERKDEETGYVAVQHLYVEVGK